MRKISDRPPLVAGSDTEQLPHLVREALNIEAGIKKKRGEIWRRQEILQVAIRPRNQ